MRDHGERNGWSHVAIVGNYFDELIVKHSPNGFEIWVKDGKVFIDGALVPQAPQQDKKDKP